MRLEEEQQILGYLLIGVGIFLNQKAELPRKGMFKDKRLRLILEAMRRVNDLNQQINLVTVKEELDSWGDLEKAGGVVYLTSLEDGV